MKPFQFEAKAYDDFINWPNANKEIFKKIIELIKDFFRDPDNCTNGGLITIKLVTICKRDLFSIFQY